MEKEVYNQIKEKASWCLNCKKPMCVKGCPLGNNIPDFINMIKQENYKMAFDILSETTIMQPICGLVCPHEKQCQGLCVRSIKDTPVKIGDLEAFIGNLALEKGWYKEKINTKTNKKVAVIGGGPAGITCGVYLAKKGYDVTIYEKQEKLGGLLVHGIPEFRLNKEVVGDLIKQILELGINVEYNKNLGRNLDLEQLKEKYDAIFISIGANKSINLNIKGEKLKGVFGANELLELNNHPNYEGKTVAVIGGGNVAIDTSRTIKRLGANKVYIIYRRAEKQMPAEKKEIQLAKQDKIEFMFQNRILNIIGEEKVEAIELIKTKAESENGKDKPIPIDIEDSNYKLKVDYVIKAIGSKPYNKEMLVDLELDNKGYIKIDENYKTSDTKIFAGGDITGTKTTVAYAAKTGREAAKAIDNFLKEKNS